MKNEETKIKNNNIKKENSEKEKIKSVRKTVVAILVVLATIIGFVVVRGNYLEIKGVGQEYITTFWKDTFYRGSVFIVNFIFLFLCFFTTNKRVRKGLKVFFDDEKKEMPKFPNKSISFGIALVTSFLTTDIFMKRILLCFGNTKFGITDPVFNVDISFFVLYKPIIEFLIIYLLCVTITTIIYAISYFLIILNKSFDGVSRETIEKSDLLDLIGNKVKIVAVLVGLFILVFMAGNIGNEKFMMIELKDGNIYPLFGAGKADATVKLVGYIVLGILATFSILKAYKAIKNRNIRKSIGYLMVVPIYLIVLALVLSLYQLIFIRNNNLDTSYYYINKNIENTQNAYNIKQGDAYSEKTLDYSGTITKEQLNKNKEIISNIPIISEENVLDDLKTTQTAKGYYTYRQSQMEIYNLNGLESLVYVTPREVQNANTSYNNKTYQYTHGYGSVITPVDKVDEYGYLTTIQNGLDNTNEGEFKISEPRIYFGMETNDAAVINSAKTEFDYFDEKTNTEKEYVYKGDAGLQLGFFDRLILGIKENDLKLAFSGLVKKDSKIITNRNILQRAKSIMPYLKYDENPYLVINDKGEQYWVIDAYTVSNNYPFAQKTEVSPTKKINYIRNSAKVVINAYNGDTKYYITDRNDPIIMSYSKLYPDLFEKKENDIPKDIAKHFVYPKYLFKIQSDIIQKYHDIKPEVLFRGNDIWQVAEEAPYGKANVIKPYYIMTKSDDGKVHLSLTIPYTAYGKQNINAYTIAYVEDGQSKMVTYKYHTDNNVLGPIQLQTQINQDESITKELATLNVTGTKLTKNIIAVPIDTTILYVETIYQQFINETSQKPTLKKVVIASGNKVAIGDTLQEALINLQSKSAVDIDVVDSESIEELAREIVKANKNAKSSRESGDWKLYGEDMQKLNDMINLMENAIKQKEKDDAKLLEEKLKAEKNENNEAVQTEEKGFVNKVQSGKNKALKNEIGQKEKQSVLANKLS